MENEQGKKAEGGEAPDANAGWTYFSNMAKVLSKNESEIPITKATIIADKLAALGELTGEITEIKQGDKRFKMEMPKYEGEISIWIPKIETSITYTANRDWDHKLSFNGQPSSISELAKAPDDILEAIYEHLSDLIFKTGHPPLKSMTDEAFTEMVLGQNPNDAEPQEVASPSSSSEIEQAKPMGKVLPFKKKGVV